MFQAFIIDRVKRRTMLIWGSCGMAVDIAIVSKFEGRYAYRCRPRLTNVHSVALVAVYGGGPNVVANGFGIFFLLLFGIIFSVSWNSGCPVYCTEIFPTTIRATGGAIGTFFSCTQAPAQSR